MIATVTLTDRQAETLVRFVRRMDAAGLVPLDGHGVVLDLARQVAAQMNGDLNGADAVLARLSAESARASARASERADDRQGRLFG